jgi:hypothetical protein
MAQALYAHMNNKRKMKKKKKKISAMKALHLTLFTSTGKPLIIGKVIGVGGELWDTEPRKARQQS